MLRLYFRLAAVSVVLAAWLAAPKPAAACTCGFQYGPEESFERADAVFVGQVTAISDFTWVNQFEHFDSAPAQLYPLLYRRATLHVSQSWKGNSSARVVVRTCGYDFARGKDYLVYAYRGRSGLETDVCTRTKETSMAAADFPYLQTLPQLPIEPPRAVWPYCAGSVVLALGLSAAALWNWRRSRPGAAH